jgi:hypothetical protein
VEVPAHRSCERGPWWVANYDIVCAVVLRGDGRAEAAEDASRIILTRQQDTMKNLPAKRLKTKFRRRVGVEVELNCLEIQAESGEAESGFVDLETSELPIEDLTQRSRVGWVAMEGPPVGDYVLKGGHEEDAAARGGI